VIQGPRIAEQIPGTYGPLWHASFGFQTMFSNG